MNASAVSWQSYEDVSRYVLKQLSAHLGISDVTNYTDIPGQSGTTWKVEGKVHTLNGEGFLVMECRRHTKKGVAQEGVGGLAFRIQDTGASGAILVTPLPLQKGAALVANSANIQHLELASWSTSDRYLAKFLGQAFRGVTATDSIYPTDEAIAVVIRG